MVFAVVNVAVVLRVLSLQKYKQDKKIQFRCGCNKVHMQKSTNSNDGSLKLHSCSVQK